MPYFARFYSRESPYGWKLVDVALKHRPEFLASDSDGLFFECCYKPPLDVQTRVLLFQRYQLCFLRRDSDAQAKLMKSCTRCVVADHKDTPDIVRKVSDWREPTIECNELGVLVMLHFDPHALDLLTLSAGDFLGLLRHKLKLE